MKKFIVAILALLYIGTSTGATIHMHYCMDKLADWGIGKNDSKTCGKCGMEKSNEKNNGCCKDEHKFIKSVTDQKTVERDFQFIQLIAVALPLSFFEIQPINISYVIEENPISHSPPPIHWRCGIHPQLCFPDLRYNSFLRPYNLLSAYRRFYLP